MKRKNKGNHKSIIPKNAAGFVPQITLISNTEVLIEGCKGIEEFSENQVKFSLGNLFVSVIGNKLLIESFTDEIALVYGEISDISFS